MIESNFYTAEEVRPLYSEIIPVYQKAFQEEPWNSVSKCVDLAMPQSCKDGYSSLQIGTECTTCGRCPTEPAYLPEELTETFDAVGNSKPTVWYVERYNGNVATVMLAWKALARTIAKEKYIENPEMADWMYAKFGDTQIAWLDEVFADRDVRSQGNLTNFVPVCEDMTAKLEVESVAYRTIQPRMTNVAGRLGDRAEILRGTQSANLYGGEVAVPDWRDFVTIDMAGA